MESEKLAHFGVVGLTDESKSILLGMHELGYVGCVYDFTYDKVKDFLENEARDTKIFGAESLEEMILSLETKRCIVMFVEELMIQDFIGVGLSIDDFIDIEMLPHMSYQDYIIDAGSTGREVSKKRITDLMGKGIRYVGLKNKASVDFLQGFCISLMNEYVWSKYNRKIQPSGRRLKKKVAAKVKKNSCCIWGAPGQKQSYIELTINDMSKRHGRLMIEAGEILSKVAHLKSKQKNAVLDAWSKGDLKSSRCDGDGAIKSGAPPLKEDQQKFVDHLEKALLACQVIIYTCGFASIRELAEIHQWDINFAELKPAWPSEYSYKCAFYRKIKTAFTKNPQLPNLLLDEDFAKVVNEGLPSLREVVSKTTNLLNTVKKLYDGYLRYSVKDFSDALKYYEDFTTNKPLCARLFETQYKNEEPMEELDLSPLYRYQYQLREQQSLIEKIEKTAKKAEKECEDNGGDESLAYIMKYSHSSIQKKIENLHKDEPQPHYEACIKHMENDEKVTPLHMNILSNRINHVKTISKVFLREKRGRYDSSDDPTSVDSLGSSLVSDFD